MSNGEKKSSKLAGFFSSGSTSPRGKRESSSSGEEGEHLLLPADSKKLKHGNKLLARSKTNDSDYAALREAALYNAKILATSKHHDGGSSGDKLKRGASLGKKVGSSSSSGSSVSKKQLLLIEVNLLTQLSEQNDRLLAQKRMLTVLEDRADTQDARIAMLETVLSDIQKERQQQQGDGCIGNWFTSMFT